MLERQDIDALLVGSLYGELSQADQARLTQHLESHPGDKTALDDLQVARKAIRESRIFELQMEPPQAISALLLQEAARRAPKMVRKSEDERSEGWFSRFVRSFVAHPAMAAAATLVLVIGVAGTLYLKNGSEVASPTASQTTEDKAPAVAAADPSSSRGMAANEGVAAGSASVAEGQGGATGRNDDGIPVALADGKDKDKKAANYHAGDTLEREKGKAERQVAQGTTKPTTPATHQPAKQKGYVEVRTPDQAPKDLPDSTKADVASVAPSKEAQDRGEFAAAPGAVVRPPVVAGAGGSSPAGPVTGAANNAAQPPRNSATPAPPPPPPPAAVATDKTTSSDNKTVAKKPTDDAKNADPVFAWAKDQHNQIIQLVRADKCADAASVAVKIRNRAPDYYNSYVATDRTIKKCSSYINEAAEQDAERSQKSKPAKRVDSREAPAPAPAK